MKPNVTLVTAALLLVGVAYWYMSSRSGNQAPLTASIVSESPERAQFRILVGQLQSINFNTAIFSDQNFTSLVDITTPVVSEESGRVDPFAVLPSVVEK